MLTVFDHVFTSACRLRRIWLGVFLIVFAAPTAQAQAKDPWNNIIAAISNGLSPDAVRKGFEKRRECVANDPTGEQVKELAGLLDTQGLRSPSEQQRWIRQFRCLVSRAKDDTVATTKKTVVTQVTVRSDRTRESVRINGNSAGRTPSSFELDSGTYSFSIGDDEYRRDTVLTVEPGRSITIDVSTSERAYAEPPVRAKVALELERELRAVPPRPSAPIAPSVPSGGGSFLGGLLIGGAAAAGSFAPCTKVATAPSPYGGFYGGAHVPAGATVSSIKTMCTSVAGGGAFVLSFALIHSIRKAAYAGRQRSYSAKLSNYRDGVASSERVMRRNSEIVDSVMALREELSRRTIITRALTVQISRPD